MGGQVEIVGYGIGLEPNTPFRIGRAPMGSTPDTVVIAHLTPPQASNIVVVPGVFRVPPEPFVGRWEPWSDGSGEGYWAYRRGGDGTFIRTSGDRLDRVARPVAGAPGPGWSLQTDAYRVAWPEGTLVLSTVSGSPWPFELHLQSLPERRDDESEHAMVVLRGPLQKAPQPSEVIAPGQQPVTRSRPGQRGPLWVEVAYEIDGIPWRQRHHWCEVGNRVLLLTGQAPAARAELLLPVYDTLIRSLVPRLVAPTAPPWDIVHEIPPRTLRRRGRRSRRR